MDNNKNIITCSLCKYMSIDIRPLYSNITPYEFYYICNKTGKDISNNVYNRTVNQYCKVPNSLRW